MWGRSLAVSVGMMWTISAHALYVYELPDGSRIVTDHELTNRQYKLVRTGDAASGIGRLLAHQNPQLFRTDPGAYDRLIKQLAAEHKVDFALVKAVVHVESSFNPYAKSSKGALGLMQLLPTTAQRYGIEDIYDPEQNISAGVKHLRYLLHTFKNKRNLAVAAYNAGEQAVLRHRGVPPYPETQAYVRKVMQYERQYRRQS